MSEWKRNKRRTSGFPKGIEEGMVLEVRLRNGDVERRIVGLYQDSHLDPVTSAHFNTKDGYSADVMAYRVVSEPASAPAINPPDYSKGFPVGTTAKDIGAKMGDGFLVISDKDRYFRKGQIAKLAKDDGSEVPFFSIDGTYNELDSHCLFWHELAPIPPKTAIELQAEEVGIPEPVQLVDDAQPDADGWIEWKGGECPVPKGTMIDVKYCNGQAENDIPAGEYSSFGKMSAVDWSYNGLQYDIAAYRLHQPQEWPEERMDIVGQNGNDGLHYDKEEIVHEDCTSGGERSASARDALARLIADGTVDPAKIVRREDVNIGPKSSGKYQRTIKGVTVDVYDVLAAFGVTCQARGHAVKKLLMAGRRGHKDEVQDLREAVQAIDRSIELVSK